MDPLAYKMLVRLSHIKELQRWRPQGTVLSLTYKIKVELGRFTVDFISCFVPLLPDSYRFLISTRLTCTGDAITPDSMYKSYVTTRITVWLLGLSCLGNVAGECVRPPPDGFYGWDGRFVKVIH